MIYEKADFEAMKNDLTETKWKEEFITAGNNKTAEDLWVSLKSKLLYLRNRFVPKVKLSGKPSWNDKESFPIQKPLQEVIYTKQILHRHWMAAKIRRDVDTARLSYTKARNKVTTMMPKGKRKHEEEIVLKSKSNPKAFWSHIRRKLKTKTGTAPLLGNNKDKTSTKFNDLKKANILQKQFLSVFTREPEGEIPLLGNRNESSIFHFNLTQEMVRNELLNLNVNKLCGPNEIHPRLLKELATTISKPIASLFNKSMKYGKVPLDWKKANVSPIYKTGARNRAENDRPVGLTSIICKIMEKLVKGAVINDVLNNNLLPTKQYGFISGT